MAAGPVYRDRHDARNDLLSPRVLGRIANTLGPVEYLRLIYAGLIGYFLFGETIGTWTIIGGTIIVGAALLIAREESKKVDHT